ncbi:radical SAM protein [Agathobacter rectalis]|uniref:radical SAM protein n=1 Tax=Agathobacter rectalis TaxID=39491 RepID=UPI0027D2301E|nr:radical SAM protein [Agathobacter rectalis]
MKIMNKYENCLLCPRKCGINRAAGQTGVCGVSAEIRVARAALHYWEEPCISGEKGSGAVFFSGCSLHCVFCQNREISDGKAGKIISKERLRDIFLELKAKGANNINLVTPGQYIPDIVWAVRDARRYGMELPIVYNTSGYENADELKQLEGIVDVYLPDFKYMDSALSAKYSRAKDYPSVAKQAISEMVRQQPGVVIDDATGLIQKGVIVRQLLLPGHVNDAKAILKYLHDTYQDSIYISMMSQFTPIALKDYPEINRTVTRREYERLIDYAIKIGITNAFIQEGNVAKDSFIPAFDGEGV